MDVFWFYDAEEILPIFDRSQFDEGVLLYTDGDVGFLGSVANYIRQKRHGDYTFFNRNFHVEPTNICVFDCKFCSYSRLLKQKEGSWEMSAEQMLDIVRSYKDQPVTEVHIVGGVHPKLGLQFFADLLSKVKEISVCSGASVSPPNRSPT